MGAQTDEFDLGSLRLAPGEGRRLSLEASVAPLVLGSETYRAEPARVPVSLEVSRMLGGGYALRLSFETALSGACMRCLKPASPRVAVSAREVDSHDPRDPEAGDELESPYVHDETLDLAGCVHDAFALAAPVKVLCREECAGLCPICAADLNDVGPGHVHEAAPDPRWAKLRELKLE